jgi:hypothetical protein
LKLFYLNKSVTDPSSQGSLAVVCLRHGAAAGEKTVCAPVRKDVFVEKGVFATGTGFRVWQERRLEPVPETGDRQTGARCHVCGRSGVVFRQRRRRGRFRWMVSAREQVHAGEAVFQRGTVPDTQ